MAAFTLRPVAHLRIPDVTFQGLARYIETGHASHFLEAVLENNLRKTIDRADETNMAALGDIVRYLHLYVPEICWGSPEAVEAYREEEGMREQVIAIMAGDGKADYV